MSFLFPNLLYLLFFLAIPIVIHLFNFRRYKRIEFTNVRLLRDIEISTKSTKQLRNYLILLSRILALSFLVFAFAQPFIPSVNENLNSRSEAVFIYVDNSFSMEQGSSANTLFENAKESALSLVRSYGNSKSYYLIKNQLDQSDFAAKSSEEMIRNIEDLDIGPYSRSMEDIYQRVHDIREEEQLANILVYVISDFQKSQFSNFPELTDSLVNLKFIQIESQVSGNVSIDTVWFDQIIQSIDGIDTLYVKISNYSDNEIKDQPIRMFVNDAQTSLKTFNMSPWSTKTFPIVHETNSFGLYACRLEISDNGLNKDDAFYFSFNIDSSINVYHIGDTDVSKYFRALYANTFSFNEDDDKSIDINLLGKSQLYIVNGKSELTMGLKSEIQEKVKNGRNLLLYTTEGNDFNAFNDLLTSFDLERVLSYDTANLFINHLNLESSLLNRSIEKVPENANYPKNQGHFKLSQRINLQKEDVLRFSNDDAALRKYTYGKGSIYVYCFPLLEKGFSFLKNPLFVPLSLNMALNTSAPNILFYSIGNDNAIRFKNSQNAGESVIHVKGNDRDVIPEIRRSSEESILLLHGQIQADGNYNIVKDEVTLDILSLNYQRKESDINCYSKDELNALIESYGEDQFEIISGFGSEISSKILQKNEAKVLWKYCIILAILFIMAEVLIIKFMKS